FFLEDSCSKNKDYLVQLALKLFSIVLHAARFDEYLNLDEDDFVEIAK
ncbi:15126_t:CDS:2, partial [Gigaspora rosea]